MRLLPESYWEEQPEMRFRWTANRLRMFLRLRMRRATTAEATTTMKTITATPMNVPLLCLSLVDTDSSDPAVSRLLHRSVINASEGHVVYIVWCEKRVSSIQRRRQNFAQGGGTGAWRTGSEVRGDKVIQK